MLIGYKLSTLNPEFSIDSIFCISNTVGTSDFCLVCLLYWC